MNPVPSLQGALWSGNQQLATKIQLLSTSAGFYNDLKDFNFSTISVSTLNVPQWISTAALYVSDIKGVQIDISGITINENGLLNAPIVSVSSMNMKGFDSLLDIDVSFDFGLGKAIGGVVGGLGALVGGGLIAVGTGAGLAIQGAEQGIATMVAGRPQNFINTTNYETINFTTQLQVSTLGNAFPAYSSITRSVSSIAPNQVPGREIFTSTIFYPGQICIRSVSDPFNLITGDSNLNTSTIQSFGQWCPLEGLEPENIVANSVSTNSISTGNLYAGLAYIEDQQGYSAQFSNAGFAQSASLAYEAALNFQTGATNAAAFVGYLNRLYCYNNTGYIFSGAGGTQESASLYLGQNTNESLLNVSSIYSVGEMKTQNFYASTITAEQLNVVSTLFLTSTNIEVITSTQTLVADNLFANYVEIANFVSSFSFTTPLGNPTGAFDINRYSFVPSTTYNAVSSLTQNILNYSLNIGIQEETNFNIYNGQSQLALYSITPQNVSQWASTNLIFDTYEVPGQIDLGNIAQWGVSPGASVGLPGGATFDVTYTFSNGYANSFQITEEGIGSYVSTFFAYLPPNPGFTGLSTFRFTLPPVVGGSRSGWWQMTTPAPPPYETQNNNTFQIYQDINDTYITATDRLHLKAGDIFFDGNTILSNVDVANFNVTQLNATFLSSISTAAFGDDTYFNTNIWVNNAVVGYSGDFSSITTTIGEVDFPQWQAMWSSNISPPSMLSSFQYSLSTTLLQSFFQPFYNRPVINVSLGSTDDMTLSKLGLWLLNGVAQSSNYALGTFVLNPTAFGSRIFTDNNGFGLASNLQVVNLSNASPTTATSLFINFPSAAINIPANSATSLYWNNSTSNWSQITYADWDPIGVNSEVDMLQGYNYLSIVSPSTILTSNVTIGGTLSMTGKTITTFLMTWSNTMDTFSQHSYGTQAVQDGNGNSYNASQWRMVISMNQVELDRIANALNAWSFRASVDGNNNYTISWDVYFTSGVIASSQITFWADIVMYPREMINAQPAKNW